MKAAVLFYVPMTTSAAVCWRWHSVDGRTDSTQSFPCYDDCLANAQASGYYVEPTPRRADPVPMLRRTLRKRRLTTYSSAG